MYENIYKFIDELKIAADNDLEFYKKTNAVFYHNDFKFNTDLNYKLSLFRHINTECYELVYLYYRNDVSLLEEKIDRIMRNANNHMISSTTSGDHLIILPFIFLIQLNNRFPDELASMFATKFLEKVILSKQKPVTAIKRYINNGAMSVAPSSSGSLFEFISSVVGKKNNLTLDELYKNYFNSVFISFLERSTTPAPNNIKKVLFSKSFA